MQKKDKLLGVDHTITPRDFVGSVLIEQKGVGGFFDNKPDTFINDRHADFQSAELPYIAQLPTVGLSPAAVSPVPLVDTHARGRLRKCSTPTPP